MKRKNVEHLLRSVTYINKNVVNLKSSFLPNKTLIESPLVVVSTNTIPLPSRHGGSGFDCELHLIIINTYSFRLHEIDI